MPTIVVLTKVDKLKSSERKKNIASIAASLGLDEEQMLEFSAVTGEGRNELAEAVDELLAQPSWKSEAE